MTCSHNIIKGEGLLADEVLQDVLRGYPRELPLYLRRRLADRFPRLREKFNRRRRYFGYAVGKSDGAYVYVSKGRVILDLRIPADRADQVRRLGFEVVPRNNWQAKAGWLTGIRVPHDTDKREDVLALAVEALSG